MRNKFLWTVLAIAAIFASFIAGFAAATETSHNVGDLGLFTGNDYRSGFAAGMEKAKKLLGESGILPPSAEKVNTISGEIKGIDGDRITLAAYPVTANPLEDQGPAQRTVIVGKDTAVFAKVPLSAEEFSKLLKKFNEESRKGKASAAPATYRQQSASLSDLKLTMVVSIDAETDIKSAEVIEAKTIFFIAPTSK